MCFPTGKPRTVPLEPRERRNRFVSEESSAISMISAFLRWRSKKVFAGVLKYQRSAPSTITTAAIGTATLSKEDESMAEGGRAESR